MKIKFLTLNIFNGNFLDSCIEFLLRENPDIFVLQEVYKGGSIETDRKYRSFEIIRDNFKAYFYFFTPEYFKKDDKQKIDSGNIIFSRFSLFQQEPIYYSKSYKERINETPEEFINTARNLQFAQMKINNKFINVFNTHGVWGRDGKDNEERLKMSSTICNELKNLQNVILAGDFNISPNTKTIDNLEKYLKNIFKDELTTTFNIKQKIPFVKSKGVYFPDEDDKKGYGSAVVDMIFISQDIKVIDHYCPQVDISDHFPLVAVLEI